MPSEAGATSDAAGQAGQNAEMAGEGGASFDAAGASSAGAPSAAGEGGALSNAGDSGASGSSVEGGASGASGACEPGDIRRCSADGAVGPCALGSETCGVDSTWSTCSVQPAAADGCDAGNDANCNGVANEACPCITGVTTRPCGECNNGTELCTDGKAGQFGACTGATGPKIYYEDKDGDDYGSTKTQTACTRPAKYAERGGDCCDDDGGDQRVAIYINPGQTQFFTKPANVCGITWNYDCSANDSIELEIPYRVTCTTPPAACSTAGIANYDATSCGSTVSTDCSCDSKAGSNTCVSDCTISKPQGCH